MEFKRWLFNEVVLYEDEETLIRDAKPEEIPKLFIHKTENPEDVLSIQKNGFDLRKFGRTAKMFNTPSYLCEFDPKGIYALAYKEENSYDSRPYVIFEAQINKAIIIMSKKTWSTNPKQCLSDLFGNKAHGQLRRMLLSKGYQAVLRPGSEQIILDPKIINIIKVKA